ncbi:hypothetical protein JT362_10505 [Actinophytocola sp. S1-96]|uniref:Cysteine-rich domain-containing protein n=1 Tax=Actinophytocola gossypii TaxID=2812003 RepID=A0ABT2J6X5_9PSEU|nr:hypothetical protein [Actinophytocola gossypii]MCT2583548.1 hypothetical protein [Actinophytocola gossypii]
MACAEDKLLPAVRDADPDTLVLADGFSCRTQIEHAEPDRRPVHLAELLASGLRDRAPAADRPARPGRAARVLALLTAAAPAVLAGVLARRRARFPGARTGHA